MAERSSRVDQVCRKYDHTLLLQYAAWLNRTSEWWAVNASLLANPDLLVDRARRIAWCKVPKVASTSFLHGFLREIGQGRHHLLGGGGRNTKTSRGKLHLLLRQLMPHPKPDEDVSFCTAFMVVRHPFHRILSAYRDKFLTRSESTQFNKFKTNYGRRIIHRYRRQHAQPPGYSDVPTFWEFVEYLTNTPVWEYNEHWRPYYLTCTPCHHRYSIILDLENLPQEAQYLATVTGLPELVVQHDHATDHHHASQRRPPSYNTDPEVRHNHDTDPEVRHNHDTDPEVRHNHATDHHHASPRPPPSYSLNTDPEVRRNQGQTHRSTRNVEQTEAFYSQIDGRQLRKLYEVYKIDFEMFGYDLSPYDTYVKATTKEN
ncbi:uncharacterized protein [Panulirus ornatus]|uniref:uncharacterized protein n=1 Tax=Panulirus ornatus TaxID=150431 RepID=UPI003A8B64CE